MAAKNTSASETDAAAARAGKSRLRRVSKNLKQGMGLAWAASPSSLIRYSVLGMLSSAMPPVSVYLGARLVNLIADAHAHSLHFRDMLPVVIGLWAVTTVQRAIGAYMGFGRNLFVRRVQLEAERRLLAQASKLDLGHFDNSDWHDRLPARSGTSPGGPAILPGPCWGSPAIWSRFF